MSDHSVNDDYDDLDPKERLRPGGKYRLATILWLICGTVPAYLTLLFILYRFVFLMGREEMVLMMLIWLMVFGTFSYRPIRMFYCVQPMGGFMIMNAIGYLFFIVLGIIGAIALVIEWPTTGIFLLPIPSALGIGVFAAWYYHREGYLEAVHEQSVRRDTKLYELESRAE